MSFIYLTLKKTDRHTHTDRQADTDTQTDTDRQTGTHTDRHTSGIKTVHWSE